MKKILSVGLIAMSLVIVGVPALASADTLYRQLEVGMRGADVGSLQTFLAEDPSLYPQGLVTSYFGFLTKAAVANFQSRNGIPAVGRVGPMTLPVINAQMNGSVGNNYPGNQGGDKNAPVISNISVNTTNSEATINWNTSESASAIIYYSTSQITLTEGSARSSVNVSGTSVLLHTDLRTSHSGTITGLQSNTTYNYVVYVRDANGNETVTWPTTFRTN